MLLMEMLNEAGCPPGVVNVIHGSNDAVTFICDNPDIKAVSFVGSDQAGKYIYERACRNGKRVQCNMGAKNHGADDIYDFKPSQFESNLNALFLQVSLCQMQTKRIH